MEDPAWAGSQELPQKIFRAGRVLTGDLDYEVAQSTVTVVYREDKMRLLHYESRKAKKKRHATPVLIVYALINRYITLDLEPGRSFVQNLLGEGLDVYLIDWGYPTGADRFLNLDDYVNGYLDNAVQWVLSQDPSCDKINLMGVCMGDFLHDVYGPSSG